MKRMWGVMALAGLATIGMAADKPATEKPAAGAETTNAVAVEKIALCTGVQDRMPVGEGTTFGAEAGSVWCWMLVTGAQTETEVKQTWWHKGELVREIPLTIKYPKFRTWGQKTILPSQTGEWTVKVTDASGQVLKEATFTVTAAAEAPKAPAPEPLETK